MKKNFFFLYLCGLGTFGNGLLEAYTIDISKKNQCRETINELKNHVIFAKNQMSLIKSSRPLLRELFATISDFVKNINQIAKVDNIFTKRKREFIWDKLSKEKQLWSHFHGFNNLDATKDRDTLIMLYHDNICYLEKKNYEFHVKINQLKQKLIQKNVLDAHNVEIKKFNTDYMQDYFKMRFNRAPLDFKIEYRRLQNAQHNLEYFMSKKNNPFQNLEQFYIYEFYNENIFIFL